MSKHVTRSQAMEQLAQNEAMLEIYQLEKKNVDEIINQALNYPQGVNRWRAYSALKQQADLLAGWNAFSHDLKSSMHYNVLLSFVDYLVPQPQEDTYEKDDEIEEFPDEFEEEDRENVSLYVEGWFQHAQEVLEKLEEQRAMVESPKTESKADVDKLVGLLFRHEDETEN